MTARTDRLSWRGRGAGAYVHGLEGPVVVVSGRVAAWLERAAALDRLRVEARGSADAEVYAVLAALHTAALAWRGSVSGTPPANRAELPPPSSSMTVQEVAARVGLGDRAVTKAIAKGRLRARRSGRQWLIEAEDVVHYEAARAAV